MDLIPMNEIVQGGLVDLIAMNIIVQGGLVDLISMNVIVQGGMVDLIPMNIYFWPTQTYIQKISQKHCFFQCFYNVFRRKHRNLDVFRLKVGPKHWFLQCQGSGIKKVQCRDLPKPLKTPLFTLFSSIFPCANAAGNSNIYTKIIQKHCFFSVFTFFPSKTP